MFWQSLVSSILAQYHNSGISLFPSRNVHRWWNIFIRDTIFLTWMLLLLLLTIVHSSFVSLPPIVLFLKQMALNKGLCILIKFQIKLIFVSDCIDKRLIKLYWSCLGCKFVYFFRCHDRKIKHCCCVVIFASIGCWRTSTAPRCGSSEAPLWWTRSPSPRRYWGLRSTIEGRCPTSGIGRRG